MSDSAYEYAVIGAGVNGMMTALELSRFSERVVIIDAAKTGQGCSWAGGGILSPLIPWEEHEINYPLCELGRSVYPDLCQNLINETGIDVELQQSGMMILDCADVDAHLGWCESNRIRAEKVDASDHASFPGIKLSEDNFSIWLPDVMHVRNPNLLEALHALLIKQGVTVLEHHVINELAEGKGHVNCISDQGTIQAEKVILCNGARLNDLLPDSVSLPVRARRGQMLCLKEHNLEIRQIVFKEGVYLIPRKGNVCLIGSTVENVGFDDGITVEARQQLLSAASQIVPALNVDGDYLQWSGLRPDSGRGYPYIGQLPHNERLFVNVGHFRTGLLTAPASARLLADLLEHGSISPEIRPFQP